jgi:hypothetical protein
VENSILKSVKKALNVPTDYAAFDTDVLMHTNSVFSTLNQLGVGPELGFMIEDDSAIWADLLGNDPRLNHIKTYIFLRVRMLFDPPSTGFHTQAMQEQIRELEWRINAQREETEWTDPEPFALSGQTILDGGTP